MARRQERRRLSLTAANRKGADLPRRLLRLAILAVLTVVLPGRVLAVPALGPAQGYAGQWTFSAETETPAACVVRLHATSRAGGYRIEIPRACRDVLPDLIEVSAWRPQAGDLIAFSDPKHRQVLVFHPTGASAWVARTDSGKGYVLARGAQLDPQLRWGSMAGGWFLTRLGGTRLCHFDFQPDRTGLAGRIALQEPCEPPFSTTRFAAWSLAKGRLTVKDREGKLALRFRRSDVVAFQAAGPRAKGLFLTRPPPPLLAP
jgi:hypothetical protein